MLAVTAIIHEFRRNEKFVMEMSLYSDVFIYCRIYCYVRIHENACILQFNEYFVNK